MAAGNMTRREQKNTQFYVECPNFALKSQSDRARPGLSDPGRLPLIAWPAVEEIWSFALVGWVAGEVTL